MYYAMLGYGFEEEAKNVLGASEDEPACASPYVKKVTSVLSPTTD
jgi:hypothetical protein